MARTDVDLLRLLAARESDQVERKESLASSETKDRVRQAIGAFANDLPGHRSSGVIFVGAADDGRTVGLDITDRLLLTLADIRSQGRILPPPTMSVRTLDVADHRVAVIEVEPSLSPPVRCDGQVWIRVGPRRAVATIEEERRLAERRRSFDAPFDSRAVEGATLDDLDLTLFEREYLPAIVSPQTLAANGRSIGEQLSSLRLATADGTPTVAGLLIIGRDPTSYLPGAYVQVLRVAGGSLSDPIVDEKTLSEPLPVLLRELDEYLKINIRTPVDIGTRARDDHRSDYPVAALQQLIRNAILHRAYEATNSPVRLTWYAERIEIHSPGGPYGIVTVENFGRPGVTDYRNPTLAEAMRGLGYIQRFGAGLQIVATTLRENGNPSAEFTPDNSYVAVIVRSAR